MKKIFNIALIGNPNVGKSTIFNALTNLNQHTGNWTGKTVTMAKGKFKIDNLTFEIIDLPGTYSLNPKAKDESVACEYILNKNPDAIVVVMDKNCLARNLFLALQILSHRQNVILCLNFADEAKDIIIDKNKLKELLGIPIVQTSAKTKNGLNILRYEIYKMCSDGGKTNTFGFLNQNLDQNDAQTITKLAENIAQQTVTNISAQHNFDTLQPNYSNLTHHKKNICRFELDDIVMNKFLAVPIMFSLLLIIFWLTIFGANYFSDWLAILFSKIEIVLRKLFEFICAPDFLTGIFLDGMYRTVAWVVSVMLPPMAIFFPLFSLVEDFGLLPRIAFNLDGIFKKFGCHGKQCLTMCMGFGCNAAGVISCRTIDSKREKLIAILTNNFVPCNGRFPGIIILASMLVNGKFITAKITLIIFATIIFSVLITLLISKILSETVLAGQTSFFILELPPYRKPKIFQTFVRSIFDKTLFVLWRAIVVSIPAGILIWLLANIKICSQTILALLTNFFDPLGKLMGLDGTIITSFLLGIPANEIVFPLMLMCYKNNSTLLPVENFINLKDVLTNNGWTNITIINTIIFYLNHFPCATTLLTIKKETGKIKWVLLAFILPTLVGFLICTLVNYFASLFRL